MATLEQILAGMIEFRDEVYARFDAINAKIESLELKQYAICTMCQGSGLVIPSHNLEGLPPTPITCPSCNGAGRLISGSSEEKD